MAKNSKRNIENHYHIAIYSNFTRSSTISNIGNIFNFISVSSQSIGIAKSDKKKKELARL